MLSKDEVKRIALENGFKLKIQDDGSKDLNPYVYDFALVLINEARRDVISKVYEIIEDHNHEQ